MDRGFVGGEDFRRLLSDDGVFWQCLGHNLAFMVVSLTVIIPLEITNPLRAISNSGSPTKFGMTSGGSHYDGRLSGMRESGFPTTCHTKPVKPCSLSTFSCLL